MPDCRLPNLAAGGAYAWRLPHDETGPAMARTLLVRAMTDIGLAPELIDDGRLAVSEAATNALRHARPEPGAGPAVALELWAWAWARTVPAPQLVVAVFDSAPLRPPHASGAGLLDEHGKGLQLLGAVTTAWGSHPSRSRLADPLVQGKAVWFALPLPAAWPGRRPAVSPGRAAHALSNALRARGLEAIRRSDDKGVSVLELPGVNVWVRPTAFSWQDGQGRCVWYPLIDLQVTTEHLIRRVEERTARPR